MEVIALKKRVLKCNNELAESMREARRQRGTFTINLIGSPGSGKTTLLEAILSRLTSEFRVGVIEGDTQTTIDAERLDAFGIPVVQVVTQGGCHLDARMIKNAESRIPDPLDLLIIENVGNLVCPATFDISEDGKVVVLSVTEGEEKPLKYPAVFQRASAVVLTKTDLLPHLDVQMSVFRHNVNRIGGEAAIFETNQQSPSSYYPFVEWLKEGISRRRTNERSLNS